MTGGTVVRSGLWSSFAAELAGTGRVGIVAAITILAAIMVGPAIAALLVFVWMFLSRTPLSSLGLSRPESWARVIVAGIIFGVALKLIMKAVVMPYLGAPAVNTGFQHLRPLEAAIIESLAMIVLAGFSEELVFRGFLLNRLQAFFGTGFLRKILMIAGSAIFFGIAHMVGQGIYGALQATLLGALFATIYFLNGQRLWFLIFVHAAFDVAAVWIIYFGLEEPLARSVFG